MSATRFGAIAALLLFIAPFAGAAPADPASDGFWHGASADSAPTIRLYYFFSPTCPHCQAAKPFLDELAARRPWLEINRHVVKDNPENARFYFNTARSLGVEALSVPGFVFCRQVVIGYDSAETTGAELERAIDACHAERAAHPDAAALSAGTGSGTSDPSFGSGAAGQAAAMQGKPATTIRLPIVGTVNTQALSLPLLTVVLAGVDAFNPCAFFVLLFLLSLLVHAKSRARMMIVGGTFVLFSGVVYFIFMAAWLNVFLVAGELRVITIVAGLIALTVAALNIKDYFWFKEGPSLSIPDAAKPGLFKRMREVVTTGNMGPMLASTVLLAIVANSYELLCTAGFPMVYTRTLTLAKLESWQYYAWLAAYNVIYVLPLLAIVIVFTRTMGARKLSESEGRILKLVSGFMMLGFGLVLLLAPNLLTNTLASILVLALAVVASVLVARVAAPRTA
ncbi:MAG: thioredoxin family protein [Steroidobacteraceae bacterium]|nr:thioredoxin family protein [Steroidobacteraceae bacterium]